MGKFVAEKMVKMLVKADGHGVKHAKVGIIRAYFQGECPGSAEQPGAGYHR